MSSPIQLGNLEQNAQPSVATAVPIANRKTTPTFTI